MDDPVRVFLDANILAKPVTRTLLIAGGPVAGFVAVFSRTAMREADAHLGPRKKPVSDLSRRFGWALAPDGTGVERFGHTHPKDRQLLADAVAARAQFIVTENIDDYGVVDLVATGIGAVTADLFLAERMNADAYVEAIDTMIAGRTRPPNTPAAVHSALGRQHPLLAAAHEDLFDVDVMPRTHPEPSEVYRGNRCVRCGLILAEPGVLVRGLGPECRVVR